MSSRISARRSLPTLLASSKGRLRCCLRQARRSIACSASVESTDSATSAAAWRARRPARARVSPIRRRCVQRSEAMSATSRSTRRRTRRWSSSSRCGHCSRRCCRGRVEGGSSSSVIRSSRSMAGAAAHLVSLRTSSAIMRTSSARASRLRAASARRRSSWTSSTACSATSPATCCTLSRPRRRRTSSACRTGCAIAACRPTRRRVPSSGPSTPGRSPATSLRSRSSRAA